MPPDFHILLIDDNPADVKLIERSLREAGVQHRLTPILDGRRALEYLERLGEAATPADGRPDLILLDPNLPGLDRRQVLALIKGNPVLSTIPVVILATDQADAAIIRKPAEFPRYRDLVVTLHAYWHETATRVPLDRPKD